MAVVSFTIPDAKVAHYVAAIKSRYPNEETNPDGTAKFTDTQWAKEVIRRHVIDLVFDYDRIQARITSVDTVTKDDTLIT